MSFTSIFIKTGINYNCSYKIMVFIEVFVLIFRQTNFSESFSAGIFQRYNKTVIVESYKEPMLYVFWELYRHLKTITNHLILTYYKNSSTFLYLKEQSILNAS